MSETEMREAKQANNAQLHAEAVTYVVTVYFYIHQNYR